MNRNSSSATAVHLRDRLKQSVREEILAAAERIFSRDGLNTARMDAIAKEAGVAVGTLYNHFTDREELIRSLNEAHRKQLLERVDVEVEKAAEGREQIEAVVRALLEHLELHAPFQRILMESEQHGHSNIKSLMEDLYERTERVVKRITQHGELRLDDAEHWPTLLFGMVRGVMIRRMKHGVALDPAHVAQVVSRTFYEGAAAPTAPATRKKRS
jgi:AcrR family transcriptional regulator